MSKETISKVYLILEKIDYVEQIVQNSGLNLAIVEWIIRNGLPKFKERCNSIISKL